MTADAGEDVEKEEQSSIVGGIARWDNHSGNQSGCSSEKLNIVLPEDPATPLLGIFPKYDRELISNIHKELKNLNSRNSKTPLKMGYKAKV